MTDTHNWFRKAKAVRIEDVTAQRGIVLRGRVEREGPCPICAGTDRFSINTQKQVFNCRGCGKGGDVIDLIVFLDGCDRITAVTKLTDEPRPNGCNGSALEPGIAKQKLKDVSKDTPEDTARDANDPSENVPKKLLIATFEYTDETGVVIYVVDRRTLTARLFSRTASARRRSANAAPIPSIPARGLQTSRASPGFRIGCRK